MATITFTFTSAEGTRIAAANDGTPYPKTSAGVKARLLDYIKSYVKEYERAKGKADALKAVSEPSDVEVT